MREQGGGASKSMKFFKSSIEKKILALSLEAQAQINELFEASDDPPPEGSALEQAGLRNGNEIIEEYLRHGELGLAVDHLRYMVEETEIELKESSILALDFLIQDYPS